MKRKLTLSLSTVAATCALAGLAYAMCAVSEGTFQGHVVAGITLTSFLLLLHFGVSTLTLFVFTSLVYKKSLPSWREKLGRVAYSVILSYSPLILTFLAIIFTNIAFPRTIGGLTYLQLVILSLKVAAPLALLVTFWKVYSRDFYKSCLTVSSYYLTLMALSHLGSIV